MSLEPQTLFARQGFPSPSGFNSPLPLGYAPVPNPVQSGQEQFLMNEISALRQKLETAMNFAAGAGAQKDELQREQEAIKSRVKAELEAEYHNALRVELEKERQQKTDGEVQMKAQVLRLLQIKRQNMKAEFEAEKKKQFTAMVEEFEKAKQQAASSLQENVHAHPEFEKEKAQLQQAAQKHVEDEEKRIMFEA